MKRKQLAWFKVLAVSCAIFILASCEDSSEQMEKGDVEFEITDAPSDDASIKGVFVTVADIKVDGQSVKGFTRQTIDLKAYQEGNTKLLATAQGLDAKSYNKLTMVLDLDTDAAGNSPGCYVLTEDDAKYQLKSTASGMTEVVINKDWRVMPNTTSEMVMDFDLRKSIAYSDDPLVAYQFVSDNNLSASVRLVAKENAGTIKGSYEAEESGDDKIIAYAYKKGTFNAATETEGENDILFANAVSSAEVKSGLTADTFTLALLEEGEYELYFASHTENSSGRMTFNSMLTSETTVGGSAGNIVNVQGGLTVNVSGTISLL